MLSFELSECADWQTEDELADLQLGEDVDVDGGFVGRLFHCWQWIGHDHDGMFSIMEKYYILAMLPCILQIQMKFQKILILIYLLVQAILTACINDICQLNSTYLLFTVCTVILFLLSHLKDPGYLIVDDINMEAHKDSKVGQAEEECIGSGRQIIVYGVNNEIIKCDNAIDFNSKFHQLASPPKKRTQRDNKRYCGICAINQPFRTRHCHECEKCVSTYDHHCPWINNCVGEKNRHFFFLFLVAQTLQVFVSAVDVCSAAVNRIIPVKSQWILGLSLIIFLSAILGLTIFHGYLMISNITTWQFVKWDSIPYLCKFQKSKGSPFCKGFARNLREYWTWGFRRNRKIWQFQS